MDFTDKINATNSKNSFMLHNGIRLIQMEKDYARVEADLTRVNRNLYGAVHPPPRGYPHPGGCSPGGFVSHLGGLRRRRRGPDQRDALCDREQQL